MDGVSMARIRKPGRDPAAVVSLMGKPEGRVGRTKLFPETGAVRDEAQTSGEREGKPLACEIIS
jgi:hypothetical protein